MIDYQTLNKLIIPHVKRGKLTNTEIARKLNIRNNDGSYNLEPVKIIRKRTRFELGFRLIKTYSYNLFTYSEHDSSVSIRCIIKEDGTFKNKGEVIKKKLSNIKQYYIPVKTKNFYKLMKQNLLNEGYTIEQLPKYLRNI